MKSIKWTDALIRSYCLIHGFTVKKLTTRVELLAAFHLKNKVNYEIYGLPYSEEKEELIHPEGLACLLGIYKKGQLIGTMHLMDLSKISSYASKLFSATTFDYNPQKTYEIKGFMVDKNYQKNIGSAFNMLMYYAIRFSEQTGRDNWLVATRDTFYEKIKRRSGLPTEFISNEKNYINDGTPQARYFQNQANLKGFGNSCCYYIRIPKGILEKLTLKFFRIATIKTLRGLNLNIFLCPNLEKKQLN